MEKIPKKIAGLLLSVFFCSFGLATLSRGEVVLGVLFLGGSLHFFYRTLDM